MALEISYADKKIRNICDNEAVALRRLSPNVVMALMRRLTDLNSATNILDVPLGNPREISGDPPGEYRLDLVDGYFLMFCAVDLKMPLNDKNKVDWTKVSRLKLLRIIKDDA
jgi:proteic killer suppression protein